MGQAGQLEGRPRCLVIANKRKLARGSRRPPLSLGATKLAPTGQHKHKRTPKEAPEIQSNANDHLDGQ